MTLSIWRFSHLFLAVSSSLFILIASITGIILAVEPISNQVKPYAIKNTNKVSLAHTINALQTKYKEVVTLEVDNNDFVKASVITKEGSNETFYIDPSNAFKVGDIEKRAPIYEVATNLHRSLFLKSTGRFIVGFISLLLFLIVVTGFNLIIKRQGGLKKLFSKVVNENFEQYYHVIVGRYAMIPIIIITITGIYLSLEKFSLLPINKVTHDFQTSNINDRKIPLEQFPLFNSIKLNELKKIEFPFSNDKEDYFFLDLVNKEIYVNQYSGEIVSEKQKSFTALASNLSFILHTGQGSIIWSVVLFVSCFAILFFMYSGFKMTIKRRSKTKKIKNIYTKDEAEYIILVGSETGSTQNFAKQFFEALLKSNKKVYLSQLNSYTTYAKASHLVIFTATYGLGEPPTNALEFEEKFIKISQPKLLKYSVVGFGSLMYPDFCNFAIQVDSMLQKHEKFTPLLPLVKINNQSFVAFKNWLINWNKITNNNLVVEIPRPKKIKNQIQFTVTDRSAINQDQSFLLHLKPNKKIRFTSGDLLSIYPEDDSLVERLYSVAKVDDNILLSIKRHEFGICSNYLNKLNTNDMIQATIKKNYDFHFPNYANEVIMIANGTGIAPFLGMVNNNDSHKKIHLFWGGRTQESLSIYSKFIDQAFNKKTLSSFHVAYSQENKDKIYVQDLIFEKSDFIADFLKNEGVIMICGSINMQNSVLEILETITKLKLNEPLSTYENNEQIKMDCY